MRGQELFNRRLLRSLLDTLTGTLLCTWLALAAALVGQNISHPLGLLYPLRSSRWSSCAGLGTHRCHPGADLYCVHFLRGGIRTDRAHGGCFCGRPHGHLLDGAVCRRRSIRVCAPRVSTPPAS